jgi:hypothetical protein
VIPADSPHDPIRHLWVVAANLVGEEPIPELQVILVGVEDRVGQPGLVELGVGERVLQPDRTERERDRVPDTTP